jgi:hypothetical protein
MSKGWTASLALFSLVSGVLLVVASVEGSASQSNFSNIQVLTDMTDRDIQQTMQSWARQFGVTCFGCHVQGDFASDALKRKRTARLMAEVVRTLNQTTYFSESSRKADGFLCHRGSFEIPESD